MKKAVIKDALREIKKSYKRFISILLMAFLGVGFFAGIRASSPDMLDTIDTYYKNQNVYDIQVLSTLGLTSDDINAISKIENVEHVDGNFETDGQIEVGNKEVIAKVMSLNDFNTPVLIDGSLPSAKNECVVEERFLTVNNKNIGDTIELNIKDMQNDNGEDVPYLYEKELKIVGTVQSPMYISVDRGTSTLGSGKIDYYMYIPKSNVQANSIYTNIYVKVKDANKYTTSSKKYEDCVNSVKTEIEKIMEKVRIETGLAPEDYETKRINKSLANCNVENSFITINPDIVAYDEKTIEYVILHEFCHLKYKIRTKNFWKMIGTYMPNYEQYAVTLGNIVY